MRPSWPSLRLLRRIGVVAFAITAILILAVRLFAMSPMASSLVKAQIERQLVQGQSLQVTNLRGDLLGRIKAERLTVSDAQGVWLQADNLVLDWSPLSLLYDYLNIETLSVETLDYKRQPALEPATSTSDSALARYRLDRFAIDELRLGEGVLGPAQAYTFASSFRMAGYQGRFDADLVPVSSAGDRLRARLEWGGAVPVEGALSLTGAPSGLVASLLQVPDHQGVEAKIDASGRFRNWVLEADASVGETQILALRASENRAGQALSGWLSLDALGVLSAVQSRLGDRVTMTSELARNGALKARLVADTGTLELSGDYRRRRDGFTLEDLNFDASKMDAKRLTRVSDLAVRALKADGALRVAGAAVAFEGQVEIPSVTYRDYRAQSVSSVGQISFENGVLTAASDLTVEVLSGLPELLDRALTGRLLATIDGDVSFSDRKLDLRALNLEGRSISSEVRGEFGFDGAAALRGKSALKNIAPLDTLSGDWTLTGPKIDELALEIDGALRPGSDVRDLLGEQARFQAALKRQGGGVAFESVRLQSPVLDARASGKFAAGELDIGADLNARALQMGPSRADGIVATIRIDGPLQSPTTRLMVAGDRATISGQTLSEIAIEAEAAGLTAPSFKVIGTAKLSEAPLQLSVIGQYRSNLVRADQIQARWDALELIGEGAINIAEPEHSTLALNIDGRAPIVGALTGAVVYQDESLVTQATIEDAVYGSFSLERASLDMTGAWPHFAGGLDVVADVPILGVERPIRADLDLELAALTQGLQISGTSQIGDQSIDIATPLQVSFTEGVSAQGALRAFDGDISFAYDGSGKTISDLTLTGLSMRELGPLLLRPSLRGRMDGQASLIIEEGVLNGTGAATIVDLSTGQSDAPSASLSLAAVLDENILSVELQTEDIDQTLDLDASLRTRLQHSGTLASIRQADAALMPISLKGGGPIAPLWGLAAPPDLRLDGNFQVDINNGTGERFRFSGPLRFEAGAFEDGFTGLHLKSIDVQAQLSERGVQVETATAAGSNSGSLSATGAYLFDGSGAVTLSLNRLNAFNRSDVSATISGQAEIDRQNRRTRVQGDLSVDQARVNVANLPGSGYTTIDVTFSDQSGEEAQDGPTREAIMLDLAIRADRRIFVSGLGVDSEWSADLNVSGSAGQPRLIGQAELVRGEADLLSRRFRLSDGSLRFLGAPTETELQLSAERIDDGITSSINLTGNVMDPEISLSSDPSLPDDEILARVLFGRSPSQLSPLQAAQLAGAAAQLAGGDAFNLVGQLEAATGLDRLDIGFDESGGATLATGKYLADDVYLEVESGVSGAPGVTLEWTPLDNLAIDAEIDPELGPKVAVQWKRDFDRLPFEDEDE